MTTSPSPTFLKSTWYSTRLGTDVTLARWGTYGQPVLIFPTAAADAEEIERFLMIKVLSPLLEEGRIKVYSVDSVAGRVWFERKTSLAHRMWVQHQFHQYIKHEVVPAIRMDCKSPDIGVWATGASIGAFHAVAVTCRFPDLFHRALSMSATFNLMKFSEGGPLTDEFHVSSPLHFVPHLAGRHLDVLRTRHIHFASGEGKWEDLGETWRMANVLGAKGIPNFVDSWGPQWDHDWVTWRKMLPQYLDTWTRPPPSK